MLSHFLHGLGAVMVLGTLVDGGLLSEAASQSPRSIRVAVRPAPSGFTDRAAASSSAGYQLNVIYDRVTHRTRVSLLTFHRVERTPDHASASLAVSASYQGQELSELPDSVEFDFTTFAPIRRGWALGHATDLKVTLSNAALVFRAAEYRKMALRLGDPYRKEMLNFRVATTDLIALLRASPVELKLGRFQFRIDEPGLDGLRAFTRLLMPATR